MVSHWPAPPQELREAEEQRQALVDAAIQAGWVIRYDPERDEYAASRELHTARTLDGLLGQIKES